MKNCVKYVWSLTSDIVWLQRDQWYSKYRNGQTFNEVLNRRCDTEHDQLSKGCISPLHTQNTFVVLYWLNECEWRGKKGSIFKGKRIEFKKKKEKKRYTQSFMPSFLVVCLWKHLKVETRIISFFSSWGQSLNTYLCFKNTHKNIKYVYTKKKATFCSDQINSWTFTPWLTDSSWKWHMPETLRAYVCTSRWGARVCVCAHSCMHTCVCTRACICACVHVCFVTDKWQY